MSFSPSRTTTAPRCGAGSSPQSASSPTRSRLAGPTDYLESHSAAGSPGPAAPSPCGFILDNRLSQEYERQGGAGPTGGTTLVPVGPLQKLTSSPQRRVEMWRGGGRSNI